MTFDALNLGCGNRFRDDWVNVNFTSNDKAVIAADLGKGVPFAASSFDMVYHSHLLEHFSKSDAPFFIRECFRVLRPSGVLRVVVPDLEAIARAYLHWLEKARDRVPGARDNYIWMMLEMYDQVVRNCPGGEMANYLLRDDLPNEQFMVDRCGIEVKRLIDERGKKKGDSRPSASARSVFDRLKALGRVFPPGKSGKEILLRYLLKDEYKALEVGRFRLSGENHQWMYDSFSLAELLTDAGFEDVRCQTAVNSYHEKWRSYHLDTEPDGSVYKPDSIYMEAKRP